MKKNIIFGAVIIVLGLFIALGPKFIFRICDTMDEVSVTCCGPSGYPHCNWSAQAEIGMGLLIIALGACMLVFEEEKTRMGLTVGTFLAGIVALLIPHVLIGGCESLDMQCHRMAFPALTVESLILILFSVIIGAITLKHKPSASS